jgi:hypothetical protein
MSCSIGVFNYTRESADRARTFSLLVAAVGGKIAVLAVDHRVNIMAPGSMVSGTNAT